VQNRDQHGALCRSKACREALETYQAKGLPLPHCTVSTDAYGSLPRFDAQGKLVEYDVADPGRPCGGLLGKQFRGWTPAASFFPGVPQLALWSLKAAEKLEMPNFAKTSPGATGHLPATFPPACPCSVTR
jgi:hypothetical protein